MEQQFTEDFRGTALDRSRWVDQYLPHWSTPTRSTARYDLTEQGLRLRIDADQPHWRDDEGLLRVSALQTGTNSGPVGSTTGTHRNAPGLTVVTETAPRALWTPTCGRVEATMRASADPTCMLAIWLVGFEQASPDDSGEICIAELFGTMVGATASTVRLGVKAITDPRLYDDVRDVQLSIDTTEAHSYAAEWNDSEVMFFVDEQLVHRSPQRLDYPMQLEIGFFEFPESEDRDPRKYPKAALVESVAGWSMI